MKFNLVIADCPWQFSDKLTMSATKRGAEANYKIMSNEDLINLPVLDIIADNALLALWVPSALLQVGLDIMKAWGFEQKQTWIWVKTKKDSLETLKEKLFSIKNIDEIEKVFLDYEKNYWYNDLLSFGMGHLGRNVHEVALIGTRGKINKEIQNRSQRTVLFDINKRHSQKTELLQDNLDVIFPNKDLKRLEIFGRRLKEGWEVIGNESPSSFGCDILDSLKKLKDM